MDGLWLAIFLSLTGCGDEEAGSDSDAGEASHDAGADAGTQADAGTARVSPGCDTGSATPGDHETTLAFGGKSRAYVLHVPPAYDREPAPLVVNMHGFLSNYHEQPGLTGMSALADAEGFVLVYPNGAGEPPAWNAGDCCEYADTTRDDVGFVAAVIDAVGATTCIDLTRVYATGFSNGGFLAHRLGCELSDRLAAIASVAGMLGVPPEQCHPARALPVLQIHGDADPTVAYAGGSPMGWELLFPGLPAPTFRSAAASVEFWREHDGCAAAGEPGYSMGDATCVSYGDCDDDSEVELCTISGGGHAWPGGDPSAQLGVVAGFPVTAFIGKTSMSLDASQHIWEFFARHTLP